MSCAEKIDVIGFNQNRLQKFTKKSLQKSFAIKRIQGLFLASVLIEY